MVMAYREIGRLIIEEEQHGKGRAEFGTYLIRPLSKRLTKDFGKDFFQQSLRNMRQLYLLFQIPNAVQEKSESGPAKEKSSTLRSELEISLIRSAL